MQGLIAWVKDRSNWNAIAQNLVGSVIWWLLPAFVPVVLMLWAYLQAQSGPWIVALGVASSGAALFLRRELIAAWNATPAQKHQSNDGYQVETVRAAMREHLNSAPAKYNLGDSGAWLEGAKHLLDRFGLPQLAFSIGYQNRDVDNEANFQKAIAHIRSLAAALSDADFCGNGPSRAVSQELSDEVSRLKKELAELQSAERDVDRVRDRLLKQANNHRGIDSAAGAIAWVEGCKMLVQSVLIDEAAMKFQWSRPNGGGGPLMSAEELAGLSVTAASLRGLAMNLKKEHLASSYRN